MRVWSLLRWGKDLTDERAKSLTKTLEDTRLGSTSFLTALPRIGPLLSLEIPTCQEMPGNNRGQGLS